MGCMGTHIQTISMIVIVDLLVRQLLLFYIIYPVKYSAIFRGTFKVFFH